MHAYLKMQYEIGRRRLSLSMPDCGSVIFQERERERERKRAREKESERERERERKRDGERERERERRGDGKAGRTAVIDREEERSPPPPPRLLPRLSGWMHDVQCESPESLFRGCLG
jgi:predicted  nucleic acid-binding Zn-ribbon protein